MIFDFSFFFPTFSESALLILCGSCQAWGPPNCLELLHVSKTRTAKELVILERESSLVWLRGTAAVMSSNVRVSHCGCKFLGFFSPKQVIQVLYALLSKAVYQHLAVCYMCASPNSLSDVTMKGAKAVDY